MKKPRYTKKQIAEALDQCKGFKMFTCRTLGCTFQTLQNYFKRFPSLQAIVDEHHGELVDRAGLKLYQAVMNGEEWAVKRVLGSKVGRENLPFYEEPATNVNNLNVLMDAEKAQQVRDDIHHQLDLMNERYRIATEQHTNGSAQPTD